MSCAIVHDAETQFGAPGLVRLLLSSEELADRCGSRWNPRGSRLIEEQYGGFFEQ